MLVSVIVPVYGVERFVKRCLESLLNQTWQELEIIIVNDCTSDKSMDVIGTVLQQYPTRVSKVKILHHSINKGLPAARNTGLEVARGEYVFHFDSDDYAEADMIEVMANTAIKTGADIVYSDWYLTYNDRDRYMTQPKVSTPADALEAMLIGKMKYNVWNKLVRRSLYTSNEISFPEGYSMGEDMTMIKLIAVSRTISYIPKAFYHYIKTNTGAMTANVTKVALAQINYNVIATETFLKNRCKTDERLLSLFKLSVKYPLLFTDCKYYYEIWNNWFCESGAYIADPVWSRRTRLLQFMAFHKMYAGLKLHLAIHDFIYRMMYK